MGLGITYPSASTARANVAVPGSFAQRITKEIQVVIPNDANTITFTFDIYDGSGYPRYSIAGLAKNANHILLVERIVKPGYTYGMTANANAAANVAVVINPEYY
jgi:cobalamin biosynthesis protein CbiD